MKKTLVAILMMAMTIAFTACGEEEAVQTAVSNPTVENVASAVEAVAASASEMVSDEDFETLQENYSILVDCYNVVKELYENPNIQADAEIEDALNTAADIINEMGEFDQSDLTEADAIECNTVMEMLIDLFNECVDAMQ